LEREIKFRAWVEHEFIKNGGCMNYHPEFHGDINEIFKNNGVEPVSKYASKITYLQFTEVNDKNGKEIYQEDIVKYSYISPLDGKEKSYVWVVKYKNGMYWLRHIGGLKHYDASLFLKYNQIEVIGNTFEHPELLGEP